MGHDIDRDDACPFYLQIYRVLKDEMESGVFKHGELIPPEDQLAREFDVSRVTIRNALRRLQDEGYIERKRGFGTMVCYSPESTRDERAVAVLMVDIMRPLFAEMVKGIQSKLDKEGFKLILCDTENVTEKERSYLVRYKDEVAGFIIAPVTGTRNHSYFGQLLGEEIPFVFIDRYLPEFNIDAVVSDNVQGGYVATRHLLELGHRRIAILSEPEASSLSDRIHGAERAYAELGLALDPALVFSAESRGFDNGRETVVRVVRDCPDVTAAFCLNDDIAWGCLNGLAEAGVRVPAEFSVVGFDNLIHTAQLLQPLTTVDQPKLEMGRRAAEILLGRIQGRTRGPGSIATLPVDLVVRRSTARLRPGVLT